MVVVAVVVVVMRVPQLGPMKPLLQAVQVVLDVQLFWTQLIPHMSA
jgi:hypothetical protein